MILQHIYAPILNFIYEKITYRVGGTVRDAVMFLSFFCLFFIMFATAYMHIFSSNERDVLVLLLMGIVILASADRKLEKLQWRLVIYVPYALLGLFMLLIAVCFHSIGKSYSVFIVFILFVTICLAFVWGNRGDYGKLFKIVSAAYILFFLILLVWCAAKYGMYFGQGYSMWMNTNGFAKMVAPAVACGMHLFLVTDKTGWKIFFGLVAGAAGSTTAFTSCRAAHLILIVLCICFLVLLVVRGTMKVKNLLCFIIVFVVGFGLTTGFLHCVTPVITGDPVSTHVIVKHEDESTDEAVPTGELTPYEEYRLQTIEEVESNPVLSKLDDISSGRIHIWAMYLKRINMTGNVKTLKRVGPHNQYVELTYRAGLPAGALWLFILIAVFVMIVHGIIRKRGEWIYFVTLSYPAFLFFSMLDTGIFPMDRGFILLYYLSLMPLLILKPRGGDEQ